MRFIAPFLLACSALSLTAGELPTPDALVESIAKGDDTLITALQTARPDLSRYNAVLVRELTDLLEKPDPKNERAVCAYLQSAAAVGEFASPPLAALAGRCVIEGRFKDGEPARQGIKALLAMGDLGKSELRKAIPLCVTANSAQGMMLLTSTLRCDGLKEYIPEFLALYKKKTRQQHRRRQFQIRTETSCVRRTPALASTGGQRPRRERSQTPS